MKFLFLYPALLISTVAVSALMACERNTDGDAANYGPEVSVSDITRAVRGMVRDSHPDQTKVGAFGRIFTTAEIGGGSLSIILANTTHEVTSSTVESGILTLNIYETNTEYRNGAPTSEKITRNFPLLFKVTPTSAPLSEITPARADLGSALFALSAGDETQPAAQPEPDSTPTPAPTPRPPSYHLLRAWEDVAPPPDAVRAHPACRGIPDCRIRQRHVTFNIVLWDEPKGNLIRVELVSSPDVPQMLGFNMNPFFRFLPGLMKSCISRVMQVGNDPRNRTLVDECKSVVNFTFDSATP